MCQYADVTDRNIIFNIAMVYSIWAESGQRSGTNGFSNTVWKLSDCTLTGAGARPIVPCCFGPGHNSD